TRYVPRMTLAGSRPAAKLSNVVLPQPLGPTMETNSPAATLNDASETTSSSPKLTDTRSSSTEPRCPPAIGTHAAAWHDALGARSFMPRPRVPSGRLVPDHLGRIHGPLDHLGLSIEVDRGFDGRALDSEILAVGRNDALYPVATKLIGAGKVTKAD